MNHNVRSAARSDSCEDYLAESTMQNSPVPDYLKVQAISIRARKDRDSKP
jgi:hypothetical protein